MPAGYLQLLLARHERHPAQAVHPGRPLPGMPESIQQMTNLPRAIGAPENTINSPPNEVTQAQAQTAGFEVEDSSNGTSPFDFSSASMMPDDQYNVLLNMTMGMSELFGTTTLPARLGIKRTVSDLDNDMDSGFGVEDGHVKKHGCFEVVD
jgi:hypothetical protein